VHKKSKSKALSHPQEHEQDAEQREHQEQEELESRHPEPLIKLIILLSFLWYVQYVSAYGWGPARTSATSATPPTVNVTRRHQPSPISTHLHPSPPPLRDPLSLPFLQLISASVIIWVAPRGAYFYEPRCRQQQIYTIFLRGNWQRKIIKSSRIWYFCMFFKKKGIIPA